MTDPSATDQRASLRKYYGDQQEDAQRMYGDPRRRHKQHRRLDLLTQQIANIDLRGKNILDVGCGDGYAASRVFAGVEYATYTGVDLAPKKLAALHGNVDRAFPAMSDAEALPFKAGSFDCVFCSEVLEHLVDPRAALGEIHRVLTDGGIFILSTPVDSPLQSLWSGVRRLIPIRGLSGFHEHTQMFTYGGIKRLLSRQGFTVETKALCGFAFPLDRVLNFLPYRWYGRVDGLLSHIPAQRFGLGLSPISADGLAFGREFFSAVARKADSQGGA
jgi:SAM-dependent methyltransferase